VTRRNGLISAASLILLGNLASRLLGLAREQVIASLFGESAVTSAFNTAATVPTLFYDLVIGGAVSAALVPVLSGYGQGDDDKELGTVVGTLLLGAGGILLAIVVALLLLAGPMTEVLGVAPDRPIFAATVQFVRLVVPALLFLGLSGVVAAACYARQRFVFPAFSIALFNGGLVLSALALHERLGGASLALGVLIGAALQFAVVLPGLRGTAIRLAFQPNHPALRHILRLYAPVAAGLVVSELGVIIDRNLAWQTGEASVAIMRFATTLVQLPLGLVATATSLAALPVLSRLADENDEFRATLAAGLRLALLAIIPMGTFLVVFAAPVVRLLFERGAFDVAATATTARAFLLYAPQLPFVAVDQLLVYAFYARKDTLTPMFVGLGGVGVYLATALILIGPLHLGVGGLIVANTLQNSLHAVVLFALLTRSVGSLGGYGAGVSVRQSVEAAIAAGLVAEIVATVVPPPSGVVALAAYLAANAILVLAVYCGTLVALGQSEIRSLLRAVVVRSTRVRHADARGPG
jgi:putative peptidoglycan lipid II flippase